MWQGSPGSRPQLAVPCRLRAVGVTPATWGRSPGDTASAPSYGIRLISADGILESRVSRSVLPIQSAGSRIIPVVLISDLSQCAHDPRVAGERGEASGLAAERVPGCAARVHAGP